MRKWLPWILALLFLAAVLWVVESSEVFQTCVQKKQAEGASQHFDSDFSKIIFIYRGCVGGFVHNSAEAIIAVFTVILALATIFLWGATRDLVVDAREEIRIIQRAYLNILPAGIEPYTSNVAKLACDFFIYNAGNLPATKVSWTTKRCLKVESDLDPPILKVKEKSSNIVAPKLKIRKGSISISDKELDTFRAECAHKGSQCWLYLWGTVTYYDGFRDRWVRFCHRYNLAGTAGTTIGIRHARQHEHGNAPDET